jgi:hypothetical protein
MSSKSIIRCSILILSILLIFSVLPAAADHQDPFSNGCISEAPVSIGLNKINNPSCTANDVRLTSILPGTLSISEGCTGTGNRCFVTSTGARTATACSAAYTGSNPIPGICEVPPCPVQGTCASGQLCVDTVTFSATGQFVTGPAQRYDVGLFMETGIDQFSDSSYKGARFGQCDRIAFFNDPPNFPNMDGDTCGDIRSTPSGSGLPPVPGTFTDITIPCIDLWTANLSDPGNPITGSDGLVDINHCESWGNGADEVPTQNETCSDSETVMAGTGSKCFCGLLSGACIAFPDTNPCTDDICDPNTGLPSHPPKPDGTVCGDQSSGICDNPDICVSGVCSANHKPVTTPCTGSSNGGACDGTDSCDGNGACVDGFLTATTICRTSAGQCDVAESCTGSSAACPANGFQPATTACVGASNGGPCDGTDSCIGNANTCVDGFLTATTICRTSAGQCDVAESCNGTTGACPANGFQPATTACVGASNGGPCDGTDSCSGTSNTCVDGFLTATTICRASAGQCDVAESCNGTTGACPANGFQPATTACVGASNGGPCDGTDSCIGTSNTCVDGFLTATTTCRASAGQCDVAESCNGTTGACPANGFQPATTACVGASNGGPCDGTDSCIGNANTCVDGYKSATTICRPAVDDCDVAESCNGTTGACPNDLCAADETPCTSDDNSCTDDVCISCSCEHVDNNTCEAVCRTPGFWGTHARENFKPRSRNITQKVIDTCGDLSICGECISETVPINDEASAVEATCVSITGTQRLQLARQLTAAALNCCITNGSSVCTELSPWESEFSYCNSACQGQSSADYQICIDKLDCLNSGGNIKRVVDSKVQCQTGTCEPTLDGSIPCGKNLDPCPVETYCESLENTCHTAVLGICANGTICTSANTTLNAYDKPICDSDDSECNPGPAGSNRDCNAAIGNSCNIFGGCGSDSCQ